MTGYQNFRDSVDNKFRKVYERLKTLDAALQADVPMKEELRTSLKAHRSERSSTRRRWRYRSQSTSNSSITSDHFHSLQQLVGGLE